MTDCTIYLGDKVIGKCKMDFHLPIRVNMEISGENVSFDIGRDMQYVDDERRKYWSRNYRLMTIR